MVIIQVESSKEQLDARRQSFQTKVDRSSSEVSKLQADIQLFKQREWDLQHSYDEMKITHEESVECLKKFKEKCEKLEEELSSQNIEVC